MQRNGWEGWGVHAVRGALKKKESHVTSIARSKCLGVGERMVKICAVGKLIPERGGGEVGI